MKPIESSQKPALWARVRNSRGFSLIEMAIVLVIIGIIIAAIIKGQDLMVNSRAKQVAGAISTWRNLAMAFLDRNGRMPGDGANTGYITQQATYSSATKEIARSMPTAPTNPISVGGMEFYTYFGHTTGTAAGRNVIVICGVANCQTAFTTEQLEIIKTVDTGFDKKADAKLGQFRGATTGPADPSAARGWAATAAPVDSTTNGTPETTALPWDVATGYKAAIWAFDRPF